MIYLPSYKRPSIRFKTKSKTPEKKKSKKATKEEQKKGSLVGGSKAASLLQRQKRPRICLRLVINCRSNPGMVFFVNLQILLCSFLFVPSNSRKKSLVQFLGVLPFFGQLEVAYCWIFLPKKFSPLF